MTYSIRSIHDMLIENTEWVDTTSSIAKNQLIISSMSNMISCTLSMNLLEKHDELGQDIFNDFIKYYSIFWEEYISIVDPICGIGPLDNLTLEPLENEILEVKTLPTNTKEKLKNNI